MTAIISVVTISHRVVPSLLIVPDVSEDVAHLSEELQLFANISLGLGMLCVDLVDMGLEIRVGVRVAPAQGGGRNDHT